MLANLLSLIQPLLGLAVFVFIAWAISESRAAFTWRLPVVGILLQVSFALLVFKVAFLQSLLQWVNRGVEAVVAATEAGTIFVFGYLGGDPGNVTYPFTVGDGGAVMILAFRVLPLILVITVLSAVLWYLRILPWVIRGFAFILRRTLGVNGAVGFSAAANIFVGMVESPALIKPYFSSLSRSELFIVMSCGMATIAGTVLVFYATVLQDVLPNALAHILTASVMSAPAAIMFALLMVPETIGESKKSHSETNLATTDGGAEHASAIFDADDSMAAAFKANEAVSYSSVMDAITRGTSDGLKLMVNVGAMLLVLVALVALVNSLLSLLPEIGHQAITLEGLFGWLFAPLVWLMGIPWAESLDAGNIMGIKFALNELLAFLALSELPATGFSEKSLIIMSYAICGFANFGSLGIMIGGLTVICPTRSQEILQLAPKSLISGLLATCSTGAIAGLLY